MAQGLQQYLAYSLTPGDTGGTLPFGYGVTGGGWEVGDAAERVEYVGMKGGQRGKLIPVGGTVEFEPDVLAPLALAKRTAGALTAFAVAVGNGTLTNVFQQCLVNSLKLTQEMDKTLKATLDIFGLVDVEGTVGTDPAAAGTPWEFHHSAVTVAGSDLWCQSWDMTLNNNLERRPSLSAHTSGTKRYYDHINLGHETIDLSVTTEKPIARATQGHTADQLLTNLAFSSVYTRGAAVLTVSLAGLSCGKAPVPVKVGAAPLEYGYQLMGSPSAGGAASALTLTLA